MDAAMKAAPCGAAKAHHPVTQITTVIVSQSRNEGRSMWSGEVVPIHRPSADHRRMSLIAAMKAAPCGAAKQPSAITLQMPNEGYMWSMEPQ
jgi:hypothetical protein